MDIRKAEEKDIPRMMAGKRNCFAWDDLFIMVW